MQEESGGRLDVEDDGADGELLSSADAISGERDAVDAAISWLMKVLRVGVVNCSLNCLGVAVRDDVRSK